MVRLAALSLLAIVSWGCDGFGTVCPPIAPGHVTVIVTNAANGQPVCDATVTATDGAYSETLRPRGCTSYYDGVYGRIGTYVVRAARDGYVTAEVGSVRIVSNNDACETVRGAQVTIALTPLLQE